MKNIKIYNMRFKNFWTGLKELVSTEVKKKDVVVEIGSYAGQSTIIFAKKAQKVIAIDPWTKLTDTNLLIAGHIKETKMSSDMKAVETKFDNLTQKFKNIVKIKAFDNQIVDQIQDESIDFLYIDSVHTRKELERTVQMWWDKVKFGGKISGHDYAIYFPGIKAFVDENFDNFVVYPDTSWVVLKEN